jgi:hypothetical protein
MRKSLLIPALLALAIGVQAGGKGSTKVTLTTGAGDVVGWVKANASAGGTTKLSTELDLNVLEWVDEKVTVRFSVWSKGGGSYTETVEADVSKKGIARAKATLTTPETVLDSVAGDMVVYFNDLMGWIPRPLKFEIPLKKKK